MGIVSWPKPVSAVASSKAPNAAPAVLVSLFILLRPIRTFIESFSPQRPQNFFSVASVRSVVNALSLEFLNATLIPLNDFQNIDLRRRGGLYRLPHHPAPYGRHRRLLHSGEQFIELGRSQRGLSGVPSVA